MKNLKFINQETASGLFLLFAAFVALVINNSPLSHGYHEFLETHFAIKFGDFGLDKSLHHWINDGLMAIFFFFVGLEVKYEILRGELSSVRKASLPVIAALGGVIFPAIIYVLVNLGDAHALRGWAIPMATDIAFALGILALLGDRVPKQLKILLLSLAIIDDLIAIIVIAIFYTETLYWISLGLSLLAFAGGMVLNRAGVKKIAPYILVGLVMWACMLKSGIHATLAGVLLAMCIPVDSHKKQDGAAHGGHDPHSPLLEIAHGLKPWVAFMIMPIFAFANSGVNFSGFTMAHMTGTIPMGIILGLFFGKQIGVFSFIWLGEKIGICQKPSGVSWIQLYGLAILTGIGFTMSFFIGVLAFAGGETMEEVRVGVLTASALSAVVGYCALRFFCRKKP